MKSAKTAGKRRRKPRELPQTLDGIEPFLRGLRDTDGMVRQKARESLTSIGTPVVPFLLTLLKDSDRNVRWEAAKALSQLPDSRAVAALVDTLEDEGFGVRWLAAEGLIGVGREALIPLLERLVERLHSIWLQEGAHHVFHALSAKDPGLGTLLAAVVTGLESVDPDVAIVEPAYAALEELR